MNRFTKTEKWEDVWFSDLSATLKLLFLFLTDKCDNAGFYEINARLHAPLINLEPKDFLGAIKGLNEKIIFSKNEKKVWLKNFLEHQKNLPLNPANNAHKQIISIIQSNTSEFNYDFNYLGANEGLISPLGKGIVKVEYNNRTVFSDFDALAKTMLEQRTAMSATAMKLKRSIEQVEAAIPEFITHLKSQGETYKDLKDAQSHFSNWLSKKKPEQTQQYPYKQYQKK